MVKLVKNVPLALVCILVICFVFRNDSLSCFEETIKLITF